MGTDLQGISLSTQQQAGPPTATLEASQHRSPPCPVSNLDGTARQCHTLDRWIQQSFSLKRQSKRKRFASTLSIYPEAGENQPHISLPAQFHSVPKNLCTYWDQYLCKTRSCPLALNKAGLEEGWFLTFSFSLYSRWTEW